MSKKLNELNSLDEMNSNDLLYVSKDNGNGSYSDYKISKSNLLASMIQLTSTASTGTEVAKLKLGDVETTLYSGIDLTDFPKIKIVTTLPQESDMEYDTIYAVLELSEGSIYTINNLYYRLSNTASYVNAGSYSLTLDPGNYQIVAIGGGGGSSSGIGTAFIGAGTGGGAPCLIGNFTINDTTTFNLNIGGAGSSNVGVDYIGSGSDGDSTQFVSSDESINLIVPGGNKSVTAGAGSAYSVDSSWTGITHTGITIVNQFSGPAGNSTGGASYDTAVGSGSASNDYKYGSSVNINPSSGVSNPPNNCKSNGCIIITKIINQNPNPQ